VNGNGGEGSELGLSEICRHEQITGFRLDPIFKRLIDSFNPIHGIEFIIRQSKTQSQVPIIDFRIPIFVQSQLGFWAKLSANALTDIGQ